jgi:IS30 family transposase
MGRQYNQLGPEERGLIMAMKLADASGRAIALALGRSQSTVARELRRNGYKHASECGSMGRPRIAGGYDAKRAGMRARRLRRKPRLARKLVPGSALWGLVQERLRQRWSPEQIASTLRASHPDQPRLRVSHETIYTAIYAMPRGELRRHVVGLLRQGRATRRRTRQGNATRGKLPDLPSIHLRPPQANERLLPGHWEGDLIVGAFNRSAVGVLVCRHSLFLMLARIEDTTSTGVLDGFRQTFAPLPPALRQTLTYDQGKEMAQHRKLSEMTGLAIYFADPHSPWQRGICENTNGLLRQYFPKGTDLSVHSQRQLDAVAWEMNTRPRKTLGWRTPAEVFFEHYIRARDGLAPSDALTP